MLIYSLIAVNTLLLEGSQMSETKRPALNSSSNLLDTKEFELPDTLFVWDIENRVFQGIVLQCLSVIPGISLLEGNLIDSLFSRGTVDGIKGIQVEQDSKGHCVNVKIEVNIDYDVSIPQKAAEIQDAVTEKIVQLTGLHVASVQIVFKNVLLPTALKKGALQRSKSEEHLLDEPVFLG